MLPVKLAKHCEENKVLKLEKLTLAAKSPCPSNPMQVHLIIRLRGFILHWKIIVNDQIDLRKKFPAC
jgi:hypothetical protein